MFYKKLMLYNNHDNTSKLKCVQKNLQINNKKNKKNWIKHIQEQIDKKKWRSRID